MADGSCRCGGTGWYVYDAPYGHARFGQLVACPCKVNRRQDRLQADLGGLAGCTFATFDVRRPLGRAVTTDGEPVPEATQRQSLIAALAAARAYAAQLIGWLYLYGPVGSGKSHLAAAIGHDAIAHGHTVAYFTVGSMIAWLKEGMADYSTAVRLRSLQTIDLLILDDVGTEKRTDWVEEQMYELLQQRYTHSRPTVITSNFAPDRVLDFRIADRVYGLGPVLELVASSARRMPPTTPRGVR